MLCFVRGYLWKTLEYGSGLPNLGSETQFIVGIKFLKHSLNLPFCNYVLRPCEFVNICGLYIYGFYSYIFREFRLKTSATWRRVAIGAANVTAREKQAFGADTNCICPSGTAEFRWRRFWVRRPCTTVKPQFLWCKWLRSVRPFCMTWRIPPMMRKKSKRFRKSLVTFRLLIPIRAGEIRSNLPRHERFVIGNVQRWNAATRIWKTTTAHAMSGWRDIGKFFATWCSGWSP